MEPIWEYTIKLIRFVLNGDVPELPENIDFEKLFAFGKSHGVENMLYVGLRDLHIDVPEETMQKFKTAYEMQIMVEATQALELEAISEAFEEAGIDHVPLKGSVIKYLYPMPDYRKSGDIDILIRPEDEERVDEVLPQLGYKRNEGYDTHDVHFVYRKPPYIELEIHRSLTSKQARSYQLCKRAWEHVERENGKKHLYHLSDEFHYMFLIAHLSRHIYLGGGGVKLFTDIYVINRRTTLDKHLTDRYIKKARLSDIHGMVLALTDKWFYDIYPSNKEIDMLEDIVFLGGSFGTGEIREEIVSSNTLPDKIRKYIKRLLPSVNVLKNRYPILENRPYLLPFMWIYRVYDIGTKETETIGEKSKEIFGVNKSRTELKKLVKAVRDN